MSKLIKNKYRLVYKENKGEQRILVKSLNSYEEAKLHQQYYKHLGYAEECLEIQPFYAV